MRNISDRRRYITFIIGILALVLTLSGTKQIYAANTGKTMCKVTFANSEGKVATAKYRNWAKTVKKGTVIRLPKISREGYKVVWETKISGKTYKYSPGSKVTIKKNTKFCLKFYAISEKTTGVRLYKNNGTLWKTLSFSKDQKAVFPAATTGNGDMVLGWSRKKGITTHPEYYVGDTIPNLSGKYYMVVFHKSQDKAASTRKVQNKYHTVYFVGDSRTLGLEKALKKQNVQHTKFVYKAGEGLEWFKSTGFPRLYKEVKKQPKAQKKAVIINLGVNDLDSATLYVEYMKDVAKKLKAYNCKMYYLSVNPVNTAMIEKYRGHSQSSKSEAKVLTFNRYIYNGLCSGKNKMFTYINTCSMLRKNGWISSKNNRNIFDGVHYSNETYLRIYDYCMKALNK